MKFKDLTGKEVNGLKVVSRAENIKGRAAWYVLCPCGREKEKTMISAEVNRYKGSCYCYANIACTEQQRVFVGEYLYSYNKRRYYDCVCKNCGTFLELSAGEISQGKNVCGCQRREIISDDGSSIVVRLYSFSEDSYFEITVDIEDCLKHVFPYFWHKTNMGYVASRQGTGPIKLLHRVILSPEKGEIIDHINGDPLDNRKCNIRVVDSTENNRNTRIPKSNKTGRIGVCKLGDKYRATITVNYKSIHLGEYTTLEEAIIAREDAEAEFGFHKNHGRL